MKKLMEQMAEELSAAFEKSGYDPSYGKVTVSNRPDLCEFQCNGAMAGAKAYKKAPFMIADDVVAYLKDSQVFSMAEVVKPGFINLKVKGEFAYGYLKSEKGVHRLVRISPFNANGKRQTSFASVEVLPELTKDQDIDIRPEDLKIDTYRASGAGGQHVNKTESAIRITHLPTGIVVQCQNERSQFANKDTAMAMLKSKLIELKERAHKEKIEDLTGELKDMGWGSQIRSYVFHPYNMVKDHRTNEETSNLNAVMNGEIDQFIVSYLKQEAKK